MKIRIEQNQLYIIFTALCEWDLAVDMGKDSLFVSMKLLLARAMSKWFFLLPFFFFFDSTTLETRVKGSRLWVCWAEASVRSICQKVNSIGILNSQSHCNSHFKIHYPPSHPPPPFFFGGYITYCLCSLHHANVPNVFAQVHHANVFKILHPSAYNFCSPRG